MTILKTPTAWLAAARIQATQLMPYFSSAVMGLVPYQVPGLKTMGVTKRGVLAWDPDLYKVWGIKETAWTLLHEAAHWLRNHAERAEKVGALASQELAMLWNYAGDAEIDDDLVAAGAAYPRIDGAFVHESLAGQSVHYQVLPKDFGCIDGKLAEEYYAHLRKKMQPRHAGSKLLLSGEGGEQKGAGQGQGKGKGSGDQKGSGGSGTPVVPHGGCQGCGSGSGAAMADVEKLIPGELGKSQAEQKRVQRAVAEAVHKYTATKGRGSVPAGFQRWAEDVLGPPQVPWQQELARVCRSAVAYRPGAGDYRYDRPSRRQGAVGYGTGSPVFPALRMPVPPVTVIQDTSGSMGDAELKEGVQEVKGILSAVGADVTFIACDAEVHAEGRVRNVKQVAAMMKGGGGTDMKPAIERALAGKRRPELLVIITDGQIGDPGPQPPRCHVIWLVGGSYANPKPAEWGRVILMKSAAGKEAA